MKFILGLLLFLFANPIFAQELLMNDSILHIQSENNTTWGAGFSISSFGTGLILFRDVNQRLRLKGSANYIFYNHSLHKIIPDLRGKAKLQVGGIGVFADWFFSRFAFISGGIATNFNRISLTGQMAESVMIGDIEMTPEDIGSVSVAIKPAWPVSPYIGVGVGKKIGDTKQFGFAFEIGAFLQGTPQVDLTATGMLTPTASAEQEQIIENNIEPLDFWPRIGIVLNYKIPSK